MVLACAADGQDRQRSAATSASTESPRSHHRAQRARK